MRPDSVHKVGDGCLVGRDIICRCTTTVEIRHAAGRGFIHHVGHFHSITLSVHKEPASHTHRTNHVEKPTITSHVGLGVFLKLAENPVPGAATITLAFKYNRGCKVDRFAPGDKEINIVPGDDHGQR